jgi:hypothetical protein
VTLIKSQTYGSAPTQTIYAAFCGGLGVLIGIIGVAGEFAENLNKWIFVVLHVVTAVLCIAGAIVSSMSSGLVLISATTYIISRFLFAERNNANTTAH